MRSESWIGRVILTISRQTPAYRAAHIGQRSRFPQHIDDAALTGRAPSTPPVPAAVNNHSIIQLTPDSTVSLDKVPIHIHKDVLRRANWNLGLLSTAMVITAATAVATVLFLLAGFVGPMGSPDAGVSYRLPFVIGLVGQLVTDPVGADEMHGATVHPDGDLVAVGVSVDLHPRVWVRHAGQPWRSTGVPATDPAVMNDVAVVGGGTPVRTVAVGGVLVGKGSHPAIWMDTGIGWSAVPPAGDLAAKGLTELTTVTSVVGGGLLAIAIDKSRDVDGEAAVFRSDNGQDWLRVPATGLGPAEVHRVIQTSEGRFVAVGTAVKERAPALWTSPDGERWQRVKAAPPGAVLWAVRQLLDGSLLSCGSVGSADRPTAACWVQRDDGSWERIGVLAPHGSPAPLYLMAIVRTADGLLVIGSGRDSATVDAATWTVAY